MEAPSCACASLNDDLPGTSVDTLPDLARSLRKQSVDPETWTTIYECAECGSIWEERYEERGHGEVPELHRLNRRLSDRLADKAAGFPEVHNGVNRVTVTLRDGSAITGVLVAGGGEIIQVEGRDEVPFQAREVVDVDDASGLA